MLTHAQLFLSSMLSQSQGPPLKQLFGRDAVEKDGEGEAVGDEDHGVGKVVFWLKMSVEAKSRGWMTVPEA